MDNALYFQEGSNHCIYVFTSCRFSVSESWQRIVFLPNYRMSGIPFLHLIYAEQNKSMCIGEICH
jgi:hypothetical protein